MNCPICNTNVDDFKRNPFCPTCHWEFTEISANATAKMKEYYNSKMDLHFKAYLLLNKKVQLEKEIIDLNKAIECIEADKNIVKTKIEKSVKVLNSERKKNDKNAVVEKKINEINLLIEEKDKLIRDVEKVNSIYNQYNADLVHLKEEVNTAQTLGYGNEVKDAVIFLKKHKIKI